MTGILIFFVAPSLYLSIRYRRYIPKSLLFSLVFALPISLVIDYIAHKTGMWIVPTSIFPFRIFDVVPIEDLFFGFFLTYFIVMYYESLLDPHFSVKLYAKHFKYLLYVSLVLISIVAFGIGMLAPILEIPYPYLFLGLALSLIPTLLMLGFVPRLTKKFIFEGIYFFYLLIIYELTGLYLNQWHFPVEGEFIGFISIFNLSFPIEELILFVAFISLAVLSYFEYFDDDSK